MAFTSASVPHTTIYVEKCVTIFSVTKRELYHSVMTGDPNHRVGSERIMNDTQVGATCAGDDLLDPLHRIRNSVRGLRNKTFVMMLVSVDDEIHSICVENIPETLHLWTGTVDSRAEKGTMPICERTWLPVFSKILSQPFILRFCERRIVQRTTQYLAVQRDQMPFAEIVAVKSFSARTSSITEVSVVARANDSLKVVIPC